MKSHVKRLKLYALANEFTLPAADKPIYMKFGTWPFNDRIVQTFDLGCAKSIIAALANEVAAGSPGTPVYQGHPDVAHLAHKYPDKSAWGWIKLIELANEAHEPCGESEATGVLMHVDWVTRPKAHAFEYFSPYWIGTETAPLRGKTHMLANEMRSVALLNYPNIKDFRLPNDEPESAPEAEDNNERKNTMPIEELKQLLGLPPEATEDEVRAALAAAAKAKEAQAADEQKIAVANQACEAAKTEAADAKKEADDAKKELENERQAHAATKTELANEKSAHEKAKADLANECEKYKKLEALKTKSVTIGLPNEQQLAALKSDSEKRMALVNEYQTKGMKYADAWAAAKSHNPELFK